MRPEFVAERFIAAARVLALPQEFGSFDDAAAFAELRGWSAGEVKMTNRDGVYAVWPADADCNCPGTIAREVARVG